MLTNEDINKIIVAQKEVFLTKEEADNRFDDLRKDFSKLQTSVDRFAKNVTNYQQEFKIYQHRTNSLERWAQKAGEKLGINYEK